MTTVCCDEAAPPLGQVRMVLAWPRPPRREENHDGMLRGGGLAIGQVWMVLAWPRPPRREENRDGMLR